MENGTFDVTVLIRTLLRPSLPAAVRSVFAQDFPGRIQILIGADAVPGAAPIVDGLRAECPARMRLDLLVNDFVYRAVYDRALLVFQGHFQRNYIHVRDVARVFIHGINHFEKMQGRPYNVGLEDANLTKLELCAKIKEHVPSFVYVEAPIGEDPDKRDYIVSNQRILATGFRPEWNLDRGIRELIKGYTILRNSIYANV